MFTLYKDTNSKEGRYDWKEVGQFTSWKKARDEAIKRMGLVGLETGLAGSKTYSSASNGNIKEAFIGHRHDDTWKFMIE